jgi:hypothetical protein
VVGFALGLTGGGGGIFAVPPLVYGLSLAPREAVGVSLASVGGTALSGAVVHWRHGQIEVRTGVIFALGGMSGAPLGTWLSKLMPESTLLILFSMLMLVIAWRMWRTNNTLQSRAASPDPKSSAASCPCQRDADGRLVFTPACTVLLCGLGMATGILSGLFGVGGGFVIVPALVLFSGMRIHTAIATSLMVIFLVSVSGVSSYLLGGGTLSWQLTLMFLAGGFIGMRLGSELSKRLSGPRLQRIFAVAVVVVALFVVVRSLSSA